MTCKHVTELLFSQHIITRGKHLSHILSTIVKIVSLKPQKHLGNKGYKLFLYRHETIDLQVKDQKHLGL